MKKPKKSFVFILFGFIWFLLLDIVFEGWLFWKLLFLYLKKYIPPIGCIGIGLKVKNLFDNGDNTWLGTSNSEGEWYIGYHGTGSMDSILGIINNGFRRGENQFYKSNENINPLNKKI